MSEGLKGKLMIAGAIVVVMALIFFAMTTDSVSASYVAMIVGGLVSGFTAWKDNNVSARNVYFQNVLKPIVKKHGLELLQEAVEGMDELQEDPEDDEVLPQ